MERVKEKERENEDKMKREDEEEAENDNDTPMIGYMRRLRKRAERQDFFIFFFDTKVNKF